MNKPIRIQLSRKKGWRMPENTVKVCRPGKWGNPFRAPDFHYSGPIPDKSDRNWWCGMNEWMVQLYREWVENGTNYTGETPPPSIEDIGKCLRGKNLACWCALADPCHADVLLELANN